MKTYNEKILEITKKIKDKTYCKAMTQANEATNPPPKVLYRGAMISGSAGIITLIAGGVGLRFKGVKWGWSSICIGMIIVVVNFINLIRNGSKRNN